MTEQYFQEAIWIAHTLFAKGSASGSSSNISFRAGNQIYISGSGTCFGTLTEEQFACLTIEGEPEEQNKAKQRISTASGNLSGQTRYKGSDTYPQLLCNALFVHGR